MSEIETELPSSVLGTHKYWEDFYAKEIISSKNAEIGEGWFGESASKRVINWLIKCNLVKASSSILDIGCGGGELLIALLKKDFKNLIGIDYSKNAIIIAKKNLAKAGFDQVKVPLMCLDVISQNISDVTTDNSFKLEAINSLESNFVQATFKICLDKGTYDAISLCPNNSSQKRKSYLKFLLNVLPKEGIFIIVSCNWTVDELKFQFDVLKFVEEIKAPSFSFGGKTGQTVSTCVFIKS